MVGKTVTPFWTVTNMSISWYLLWPSNAQHVESVNSAHFFFALISVLEQCDNRVRTI